MIKKTSFGLQLFIIGGFFVFFYMFFALTTSIYRNYKFQTQIKDFEDDIEILAEDARQKPEDIAYFNSAQWKDRVAKESLNLLNAGEKLILLPSNDQVVEEGEVELVPDYVSPSSVLKQSNPVQWREYFFGQTLSIQVPTSSNKVNTPTPDEGAQSES